jgi:hypothetical protein
LSNPFVVVLTGVILTALTVSAWLETRKRDRIKRSVLEKTNAAIEKHFMTLAGTRTQLVQEKWSEEIRYFMLDHLRPALSREELTFFHENFAALALAIERAVENATLERP